MLAEHRAEGARILAGGTDILVDLKHRVFAEDQRAQASRFLVSLCRIPGLHDIVVDDSQISIGAMVTMTALTEHPEVRRSLHALAEGASEVGSPLVRNRGTLAGNIANARPAADTAGPAIALGGILVIEGPQGVRRIPVSSFHTGPGRSVLAQDEIIRAIEFPIPALPRGSAYVKLAVRKALDISIVGVSASLTLNPDATVADACVCLTSVGPVPILSEAARVALTGTPLTDASVEAAARAAQADARPIDDFRGSAWYRKEITFALTKRMLRRASVRARGEAIA